MTITAGVDVGTGAVKAALFETNENETKWLAKQVLRGAPARSVAIGGRSL